MATSSLLTEQEQKKKKDSRSVFAGVVNGIKIAKSKKGGEAIRKIAQWTAQRMFFFNSKRSLPDAMGQGTTLDIIISFDVGWRCRSFRVFFGTSLDRQRNF